MFTFLHPGLWPWALAVAVPLVIHLLTRRTRRRMDLPTVRFLQKAMAHQSRLLRWRDLLLLALRVLAILLLVAAFMKPTLNSPLAAPRGAASDTVIVLDTSASMSYAAGGVSDLARAKAQAIDLLQRMGPGDRANVILVGAQPHAVLPAPSDDRAAVVGAIGNAEPSEQRGDPVSAINMAADQLAKSPSASKRIAIFSDFKRTTWADVKFDSVPADTRIAFFPADTGARANLGITSIRLFPTSPRVGEPVTVQCEVFNSSASMGNVPVTLSLSDGRRMNQQVTVAPYSSAMASFPVSFATASEIECTASMPTDNMPVDNTRQAVIDLRQMATVVLITDEDVSHPSGGAFFLAHALHPDPTSNAGFRVFAVKPANLNNPILHSADAVVVCDAPSMPSQQYQALARYAENGGNLVWFLYGDNIANQIAGVAKQLPPADAMPLQVENVEDLTGNGKGYVSLAEADYQSPLLSAFKDPASTDLSKIRFTRYCATSEVDPRAQILLKFEDGTAAAVRSGLGSGNLLLMNMSPDPAWSDLARQDCFLPLVHEFLKGLMAGQSAAPDTYAGGSASTTLIPDQGKSLGQVSCVGPSGDVPVTSDPITGSVVIANAPTTGFYDILQDGKPAGAIAVNVHPDESDLRAIDPQELESDRLKAHSLVAGIGFGDIDSMMAGRPLWQDALFLAILCLFAEQAIARLAPRVRK